MSYSDYGLDVIKIAGEEGKESRSFFCPWTQVRYTGKNFYLCFADRIISRPAILAFQQQQPEAAEPDDRCQKCNQPVPFLHYTAEGYTFETGMRLGICPNCVAAAAHYILEDSL
jgi:hypothetical protein